ncbi:MAG: 16S rRNA (uracil(1498)-N(3))-methyltransferase [Kangiellaceae bacterium]|jgi:16S rRNA (uracil1498-N3)-methyltransferase|nr:16S rRNA (uracil(1498)-N(3))-methyltransferase [Kangiellaceae bacterium]
MRLNRIYINHALNLNDTIELPKDGVRHLVTVLKMTVGQDIELFNGDGISYRAVLVEVSKKSVVVKVFEKQHSKNESSLDLHLYQTISRGDKMDLTIQKAVELGVKEITPITSERCGVKLAADRLDKKMEHWHKVIISACEQSGRNVIPTLNQPSSVKKLLSEKSVTNDFLVLHPHSGKPIKQLGSSQLFNLIIGPEGGFTDDEVVQLIAQGAQGIKLGPRILRTETVGLSVISILQSQYGDM